MEQDIFEHLLEIENSAKTLAFDAQTEADNRISSAKARAEEQFKAEYEKLVLRFDENFKTEKQSIDLKQQVEEKKIAEQLSLLKKDINRFNSYLDSYFFGV